MTREYGLQGRALQLRRQGMTYSAISSELKVAKSTLASWFQKSLENFSEITKKNISENRKESKERLLEFTKKQKKMLFLKYEQAVKDAQREFEKFKLDPLFVAGLMLYAGEGDNKSRHHIRISNTDWKLHSIFLTFCEKYLLFSRQNIHIQLLIYADNPQDELENFWSEKTAIHKKNFYKTQIIQGKSKRRLQFGICMTIINSTRLKYKLLEWISLCKEQFAGMV